MYSYQICVALDERLGLNDVSVDLRTNQQHPLHEHDVHTPRSRAVALGREIAGRDMRTQVVSLKQDEGLCKEPR